MFYSHNSEVDSRTSPGYDSVCIFFGGFFLQTSCHTQVFWINFLYRVACCKFEMIYISFDDLMIA